MEKAVIVSALRSPICKAIKGSFIHTRIDDIAAEVIKAVLKQLPSLPKGEIEDVLIGCAMPEEEQGLNVARHISFLAGLPSSCSAVTVNRFCASSLEAINMAARMVATGCGKIFIAGGIESMTHVPMGGYNPSFNEKLTRPEMPDAYIGMGHTAEIVAKKYGISREEQDRFALLSHQKAARAQEEGLFSDEIVTIKALDKDGNLFDVDYDECVRKDTSLEKLSKLKPAFEMDGTVTAGNSSPINDGVAVTVVMSKKYAKKLGIKPMAEIVSMATAGVDPRIMGIGPVAAVPKALERAKMRLKDVDIIELNEAFASQSLAVIKELGIDQEKLNIHGGAIALGHPLGCSGARIMTTLIHALKRYDKKVGLATMCVGGGQGIATIVKRV